MLSGKPPPKIFDLRRLKIMERLICLNILEKGEPGGIKVDIVDIVTLRKVVLDIAITSHSRTVNTYRKRKEKTYLGIEWASWNGTQKS